MWRQCDTSFFYSLAELSKSHIFPSPFSPAFTQVIGHFAASLGQVGCLLPWPDPCCCCNGDSISTSSLGLFHIAFWGESCSEHSWGGEKVLKYDFSVLQWSALSTITHILHFSCKIIVFRSIFSIYDLLQYVIKKNNNPKCRLGGKCWIKNN